MEDPWRNIWTIFCVLAITPGVHSWAGGGLCNNIHVDYVTSQLSLATPQYPKWFSVDECTCVVTMTTRTMLHAAISVEAMDDGAPWCQPEVQFIYRRMITSVCPSLSANASLEYEVDKLEQVKVIVRNSDELYIRTMMRIEAIDGSGIHVSCGGATLGLGSPPDVTQDASSVRGAEKGALAAGAVVLVITVIILVIILIKLRCSNDQKPINTPLSHTTDIENLHDYQRVTTTEDTVPGHQSSSSPAPPPQAVIRDLFPPADLATTSDQSGSCPEAQSSVPLVDFSAEDGGERSMEYIDSKTSHEPAEGICDSEARCDSQPTKNTAVSLMPVCNNDVFDRMGHLPSLGRKSPRTNGRIPMNANRFETQRSLEDDATRFYPTATPSLFPRGSTPDYPDTFDRSRPGSTRSTLSRSGSTSRPGSSLSRPGSARLLPKHPINLQRIEYPLRSSDNRPSEPRSGRKTSLDTTSEPSEQGDARAPIFSITDEDFDICGGHDK